MFIVNKEEMTHLVGRHRATSFDPHWERHHVTLRQLSRSEVPSSESTTQEYLCDADEEQT